MKRRGTVLRMFSAALALLLTIPSIALADCRKPSNQPPFRINVKRIDRQPSYRNDLGVKEIERIRGGFEGKALPPNHSVLGLTVTEMRGEQSLKISYTERNGVTICAWPESLDVTISFSRLEVYVAKEFPKGGCPYEAVLDHENQHVAINQRNLDNYRREAQEILERNQARMGAMTSTDPKALQKSVAATISSILTSSRQTIEKRMRQENGKIDTKESYAQTRDKCNDWKGIKP